MADVMSLCYKVRLYAFGRCYCHMIAQQMVNHRGRCYNLLLSKVTDVIAIMLIYDR